MKRFKVGDRVSWLCIKGTVDRVMNSGYLAVRFDDDKDEFCRVVNPDDCRRLVKKKAKSQSEKPKREPREGWIVESVIINTVRFSIVCWSEDELNDARRRFHGACNVIKFVEVLDE